MQLGRPNVLAHDPTLVLKPKILGRRGGQFGNRRSGAQLDAVVARHRSGEIVGALFVAGDKRVGTFYCNPTLALKWTMR